MTETKKYTILKPEPFILGGPNNPNKYPGGYLGKVVLTSNNEVVYECIDSSPMSTTNNCIFWCMLGDKPDPTAITNEPIQPITPEVTNA